LTRTRSKIEYGGWELKKRLETNKLYGTRDITPWILKLVDPKSAQRILDVGCGSGEQVIPYAKKVGARGQVVGTDISPQLLREVRKKASSSGVKVMPIRHDANKPFPFDSEYFDTVSCCFTIYHVKNLEKLILEFQRLLKRGGRAFITIPDPKNNEELFRIHQKITGKMPIMPRNFFKFKIERCLNETFRKTRYHVFRNTVIFPTKEHLISYYKATQLFLANIPKEDRKETLRRLDLLLDKRKKIKITKVVGAYLAWK
jgi:ubiquinone/menaquinone biosynthesis C-methylase UbiE